MEALPPAALQVSVPARAPQQTLSAGLSENKILMSLIDFLVISLVCTLCFFKKMLRPPGRLLLLVYIYPYMEYNVWDGKEMLI